MFVLCSILFRSAYSIACSACIVPCALPICPILLTMHVLVMALTHLICMFELYASMHSPFHLIVESSYFPYAVHDICIYGKLLIYFQMIIPCPCIHPLPYTFMMTSAINTHYILIISGADPGFLDRGFKFAKGGFDLIRMSNFS